MLGEVCQQKVLVGKAEFVIQNSVDNYRDRSPLASPSNRGEENIAPEDTLRNSQNYVHLNQANAENIAPLYQGDWGDRRTETTAEKLPE